MQDNVVLITGSGGYIGSILQTHFEMVGIPYIGIDKRFGGERGVDVSNYNQLSEFVSGFKYKSIVHLAANSSVTSADEADFYKSNVIGTTNVVRVANENKISQIVFASSAAIYSSGKTPEHATWNIKPKSLYGKSKLVGESICLNLFDGVSTCLRFFNVAGADRKYHFGDRNLKGFVSKAVYAALTDSVLKIHGDGSQIRDFIHVDDVVEVITRCVDNPHKYRGVYNVGTGDPSSVMLIVQAVEHLCSKKIQIVFDEKIGIGVPHSWADAGKLKTDLYVPTTSVNEIVTSEILFQKKRILGLN